MRDQVFDLTNKRFNKLTVLYFVGVNKHRKTLWKCKCDCGNETIVLGAHLKNGNTKSCGCLNKNKVFSEETRKKLSETMKGRKLSKEHKRNISKAKKGVCSGKNNPNYNPNLTDEDRRDKRNYPEYREWRKAVYKRDNYTCQVCGSKKSGNLIAHHLESYNNNPDLRTKLSNGITLCKDKCHKNFHHQYGYGNNTKIQFEEFLEKIICAICPHS